MAGGRAGRAEYAERVNAAADLVDRGLSVVDVALVLSDRFGVSARQARRYVDQAVASGRQVVPAQGVVFTVRLPAVLATRVRRRAAGSGVTISALVTQALTELLSRGRASGPRG